MATAMAALSQQLGTGQNRVGESTAPESSAASGSSSASANSATISANDFLTLLVTEMKNQDPTAATDPNQYINQLVQVNSLEQLININQNLSTALGTSITGGTSSRHASGAGGKAASALATQPAPASATGLPSLAPGNLGIPEAKPAAQRLAQALNGLHQS